MSDRRFLLVASVSLVALISMTILGAVYQSFEILFNILLAIVGVIAGFITNAYFAARSERHNLGQYASHGYRLSVDIYDCLNETIERIENLQNIASQEDSSIVNDNSLFWMLETISGRLRVVQRFSLSANKAWADVLPPEELRELSEREEKFGLSEHKELILRTETLTFDQDHT